MKKAANCEAANKDTYFRTGAAPLWLRAAIPGQGSTSQARQNISAPLTQDDGFWWWQPTTLKSCWEESKGERCDSSLYTLQGCLLLPLQLNYYRICYVSRPERPKEST